MLETNITYKQISRLQLFWDETIYNSSQYQYYTSGPSNVINSMKMRFDLKGVLSNVILSRNARAIVEMACIPSITNMAGQTVIVRLCTSTQDKIFDSKKNISGNPILFCMAINGTVSTLNTLYNTSESFCNVNVPSNFLSNGYIDIEIECPSQKTTDIDFTTGSPLNNFFLNLVIIDEDLERTYDTVLAPKFEIKNYNTGNIPIRQY